MMNELRSDRFNLWALYRMQQPEAVAPPIVFEPIAGRAEASYVHAIEPGDRVQVRRALQWLGTSKRHSDHWYRPEVMVIEE